jgi:hypothetical protein
MALFNDIKPAPFVPELVEGLPAIFSTACKDTIPP